MKRLRWQILVVVLTLIIVGVLLLTQQSVLVEPLLPQPASGGVYTEAMVGSMGRLNPLFDWNNPADRDVNRLIFNGLIRFDERGFPRPDLAESWGVSQDGMIYNFTIRPNAVWHDGQSVTSDDVIFTIDLIKSNASFYPQDIKDLWAGVEITRLNEKNLKFTLTEPYAPFLDYLTFGVLPKHLLEPIPADQIVDADFNLKPIGSGPYKLDHLIVENGQITGVVLTTFDGYFGKQPFIPQVVFRYYPSSASAYDAYRQGEALGISHITEDVLSEALADPNLSIYTGRLPMLSIVLFNLNDPTAPFLQNDVIRKALMLGLNRSYIVNHTLGGQAIIADGPILPGSWAYYDDVEHLDFEPEQAISLLKSEGYTIPAEGGEVRSMEGERLSLTLMHPNDELHTEIAQIIQENWAYIGVEVNLIPLQYDQLIYDGLANRNYQAALVDLNLSRSPDPDPYPFWHQSEDTGGQNYTQWDNRTASEYLEQARVSTDFDFRARLYRNFQVIFAKELPSLPLYFPVYTYAVDAQVNGVQIAPLYDTSDRLNGLPVDWYLVTRRSLETEPTPAEIP
ncbi:MAG: peptide ABC transporter substrate-binding protein [Anaerolineales bacterium]|nr:peptide ABC transporter substrate-binding protein [Anaerolineales bacterium]